MTNFPTIQEKVCADAVSRMEQAKDVEEFNAEKAKLLEALNILQECSPSTYKKYSACLAMEFNGNGCG